MAPRKSIPRSVPSRGERARVYAAGVGVDRPEASAALPAKLARMLRMFDLERLAGGGPVPIKMHLGGGNGYTTVHPVFVRTVVNAVKATGGKPFIVDGYFDCVRTAGIARKCWGAL